MRNYYYFICTIFICSLGCKDRVSKQSDRIPKDEVFAPALRDKLNEFFLSVDFFYDVDKFEDEDVMCEDECEDKSKYDKMSGKICVAEFKKHKELYRLSIRKEGRRNIVFLHTDYFYNKQKIKGYTFIGDRLVVYDGNYTGQPQNLVDTSKLIQFVGTIPGYDSDEVVDIDYEVIMQEHIIHTRDSLILTYFGY